MGATHPPLLQLPDKLGFFLLKHSSNKWFLRRRSADFYFNAAREEGYRSRAAYKLLQIDEDEKIFKSGMVVVDLGAAPGGWSQVAIEKTTSTGHVIAVDCRRMVQLLGGHTIHGDFSNSSTIAEIDHILPEATADLVLSDMAPNLSGIRATDQMRTLNLCELALDFCRSHLRLGGTFLVKIFQGNGFSDFQKELQKTFKKVKTCRPQATSKSSREVYLLAKYKNPA